MANRKPTSDLLHSLYKKYNDEEYKLAYLLYNSYAINLDNPKDSVSASFIQKIVTDTLIPYPNLRALALSYRVYSLSLENKNYHLVFEYALRLEKLLERFKYPFIEGYARYYIKISDPYYKFKNYGQVIEIMKRVLSVSQRSSFF